MATTPAGGLPTSDATGQGERVSISGHWATVWATSTLASDDDAYAPSGAFDGDPATAWVEGAGGYGAPATGELAQRFPRRAHSESPIGESITARFDEPVDFDGIVIRPGYLKSAALYERNGVPAAVEVSIDGRSIGTYSLPYALELIFEGEGERGDDARDDGCYHVADQTESLERLIVFRGPIPGRRMTVRVVRVGIGSAHEDTAISEIRPLLSSRRDPLHRTVDVIRNPSSLAAADTLQDLRQTYLSPHEFVVWETGRPASVGLPGEGLLRPRLPTGTFQTAEEAFAVSSWPHLLETALLVEPTPGETTLTGSVSDSEGDGEWAEVRPRVSVSSRGRLISAQEVVAYGAAPGCPGNVGRLRSASVIERVHSGQMP